MNHNRKGRTDRSRKWEMEGDTARWTKWTIEMNMQKKEGAIRNGRSKV